MEQECDALIAEGNKVHDALVAITKNDRTYENSIKPMAKFESFYSTTENNLTFYRHVSADKEMRDQAAKVEEKMDEWGIKLSMRLDVYRALADYREVAKSNGEWEKLNPE